MILPIYSPQPFLAYYESAPVDQLSLEVVAPESVVEAMTSDPSMQAEMAEMRSAGTFDVYVTDSTVSFYLGILDETVQIGVNDDGSPVGLLTDDSEAVLEWAEDRFERFKSAASPLDC